MSRAVIELEDSGLVARARNDADGRGWVISLTDEGRAALHDDRSSRRDVLVARIAAALDERDRALLELVPPLLLKLADASPADLR
jgi:DNA-binding MarR family transcriptional regulator